MREEFEGLADETTEPEVRGRIEGLGYPGEERSARAGAGQLAEGLASALGGEETVERLVEEGGLAVWAASSSFWLGQGPLMGRLATWLQDREHPEAARLCFEAAMQAPPRRDEEAELFGALPEEGTDLGEDGVLRRNETARVLQVSPEVAGALLGREGEEVRVLGAWFHGTPRLVVVQGEVEEALEALERGRVPRRGEGLESLLAHGLVVWLPRPRRAGEGDGA